MVALSCHLQSIVCCDATATPRPMNLFISVCKLFVCMMPFKCIALKINFVYPSLLHVTLICVHVLCNCKQSLHMWLCQLYVHYQVTWQYCLCLLGGGCMATSLWLFDSLRLDRAMHRLSPPWWKFWQRHYFSHANIWLRQRQGMNSTKTVSSGSILVPVSSFWGEWKFA